MNINEAFNILNLVGTVSFSEVKKAYRACSLKYHPDRNPAEAETMKLVNIAYDFLSSLDQDPISETDGFVQNDYSELFNTVLNQLFTLQEQNEIDIEICGSWIWITGDTKPLAPQLGRKEGGIGCFFSKKNGGCWYYRPSEYKSRNRKSHSMDEIRERHGSTRATRQAFNRQLTA